MNSIYNYFPNEIQNVLKREIDDNFDLLEEIRIRVSKPIVLKYNSYENIISYFTTSEDILSILELICENSIYAYQREITEGFITLKGGHRVGITGSCICENDKVININYINSLNFRICRQVIGCSRNIIGYILNKRENNIYNTLIVSPPGYGKTTILRDIVRQISDGIEEVDFKGINVGVADERGEIGCLYKGVPQNNLGMKTDIIENVSKSIAIKMLVRSMAPKVIVADEIGNKNDIDAINYALCSGCKGIFTAHGSNFEDILLNEIINYLVKKNVFDVIIFLDSRIKGETKDVFTLNRKINKYEIIRSKNDIYKIC